MDLYGCCSWCPKVAAFGAEAAEASKAKAKEKEKHTKAATTPATVPQVGHHITPTYRLTSLSRREDRHADPDGCCYSLSRARCAIRPPRASPATAAL